LVTFEIGSPHMPGPAWTSILLFVLLCVGGMTGAYHCTQQCLTNILPELASSHNPPNLCHLSRCDYRHDLPCCLCNSNLTGHPYSNCHPYVTWHLYLRWHKPLHTICPQLNFSQDKLHHPLGCTSEQSKVVLIPLFFSSQILLNSPKMQPLLSSNCHGLPHVLVNPVSLLVLIM
jgi:hypothetical protein